MKVTVKCKLEADAVGSMLLDLANNFKEGKVVIQKGPSFVTMRPAGQIEVEIEAVEKKGKQKIEIQLRMIRKPKSRFPPKSLSWMWRHCPKNRKKKKKANRNQIVDCNLHKGGMKVIFQRDTRLKSPLSPFFKAGNHF